MPILAIRRGCEKDAALVSYIARGLLQAVAVALGIATLTFLILHLSGDPTSLLLPPQATREDVRVLREAMGFNRPLYEQYFIFMGGALRGDFGRSFWIARPALDLVLERMPATLLLTFTGLATALLIGIPIGILSAVRRYSFIDNLSTVLAMAGQAMPTFWLGLLFIMWFALLIPILPASGAGTPQHLILPSLTLGAFLAPTLMRLTRSQVLDILTQDYVRTARAKGLKEARVVVRHVLRNAAAPIVTVIGLQFGRLLGGSIVTETVYNWPGVASLTVRAIFTSDYPVVQVATLLLALVVIGSNLLADVSVAFLDPRIRYD
jgi:peptide/nickel transport system permease protein